MKRLLSLTLVLLLVLTACGGKAVPDGDYEIELSLTGGTGRASIASPCALTVREGQKNVRLVWSSPNYDYMLVDDVHYEPELLDGHAVFTIPVAALDEPLEVVADTVAMSTPHEIAYTIRFDPSTLTPVSDTGDTPAWEDMTAERQIPMDYAAQLRMTAYPGGYLLLDIDTSGRFLIVPEGKAIPAGLDGDITPLCQPLERIYLTATSAMDFFRALDGLDHIRLSGTDASGWYISEARQAMEEGRILFAGKYNAPDYELIYAQGCDLAIESTMIYHAPEVKEQLEKLDIPVLVERSSYEEHPLGRMEWVKLYGALLGRLEAAEDFFAAQAAQAEAIAGQETTGKTVAFFYINAAGTVNVRRSGDYVPRMIALAGGEYIFPDLDSGSALSTVNMTMEAFWDGARDADVLIYNSTIDGELYTMDELLAKSPLLGEFRAVQTGDVWCTGKNLFQEPTGLGTLMTDIHRVLTGDVPEDGVLTYLHRLKG